MRALEMLLEAGHQVLLDVKHPAADLAHGMVVIA